MDKLDWKILGFWLAVTAIGIAMAVCGCGGSPSRIPDVPDCPPTVHACAGSSNGGAGLRSGTRCATCDGDADLTLSCQTPDNRYATCVADCSACDSEPRNSYVGDAAGAEADGVHLCPGREYLPSSWCATCDDLNQTLAVLLCDKDGFCDPVVCVGDCSVCLPYPAN